MTPKEKAIGLVVKYYDYVIVFDDEGNTNYKQTKNNAKECALITVDEIINSRSDDGAFDDFLSATGSEYYTTHPMYLTYWEQVKQEIQNL